MKKFLGLVMIAAVLMLSVPAFAGEPTKADNTSVTMTDADTEYDWTIPNGVASITVRCRGAYDVKCSFTDGASGTTYFTVPSGGSYYETNVSSYENALHFQCATSGQVLEIIYWQ